MTERAHIRDHEERASRHASREDFRRIFSDDMHGLYQLSLLLVCDPEKAERCFVGGFEDCVAGNSVFREWVRTWAKRVIIQNAIRELSPRPRPSYPLSPTIFADIDQLSSGAGKYFEIDAVLGLEDYERFVFVMCVLEHYSEHDCALLLGCSVPQVREARTRALKELADSLHIDSPQNRIFVKEKK